MDTTLPKFNRPKSRQSLAHPANASIALDMDNNTADVGLIQRQAASAGKKKSRGKSLGPGGLEALRETSGNATTVSMQQYTVAYGADAVQLPTSVQIRSILKPTVPLTPPKVIPTFEELRKRSTGKAKSPAKTQGDEMLIDFSTPALSRNDGAVPITGAESMADPFSPMARKSPRGQVVVLKTEEEQQDTSRGREAELRRQSEKQAILDQRAARRKSMANRRVSFAPEATLHTWSVMELAEDSTTSSASNSTRRQSSMIPQQSPSIDPPSTPPEQTEEPLVRASPAHQRDVHQAKRRRSSSGIPPTDSADNELFSSSPSRDGSVVEGSPTKEDSLDSSESDDEGDTAMSMENTASSVASGGSSSTQSSLDERLRRASDQAGTRGIDYDENGEDLPMELATGTITNAFQPWVNRDNAVTTGDREAAQDQENVDPALLTARLSKDADSEASEDHDETMEVTQAVGGILLKPTSPGKGRRKSLAGSKGRHSVGRRVSTGESSVIDDETMDLTVMGGGILPRVEEQERHEAGNESTAVSDEDLTMEFTTVFGSIVNDAAPHRRESVQSSVSDGNDTMDMTAAVGGILPPIEEQTEPVTDAEDDETGPMDFTKAVGHIKPAQSVAQDVSEAKAVMQEEMDQPAADSMDLHRGDLEVEFNKVIGVEVVPMPVASEAGSSSLALKPRHSGRRASATPTRSTTPKAMSARSGASPSWQTPTKQLTPLPDRANTPSKTPTLVHVAHRSASPKKLFKELAQARASPTSTTKSPKKASSVLFAIDEKTGNHTPSVVLHAPKPHQHLRRKSSGIGIDQECMGSPLVAALLDRRASIGDAVADFIPQSREQRSLRFEDPRILEQQVDAERAEEERRESGRFAMEQEADENQEENATLRLNQLIQSMSPKKSTSGKVKGRKSLAVGAARGLLGKRPVELDTDDDDEEDTTPKRLRVVSREASPVKKVHLPKPPSKDETTRRLSKPSGLFNVPTGIATPTHQQSLLKGSAAPSPDHAGHFKSMALDDQLPRPSSFEDNLDNVLEAVDVSTAQMESSNAEKAEEKISLQTFLNMTNIHFIELSTTKRRHTTVPEPLRPSQGDGDSSLQACFTAAATTLPLLELYQHATRELKSYISSGRKIIRTIEAETLVEQPPLFREYVDARPDIKMVMDNQFRNGKSNARLQSKQGWYTWRGQLVEGLHGALVEIRKGMEQDMKSLGERQEILSTMMPELRGRNGQLEERVLELEQQVAELDSVDHEAVLASRLQLKHLDEEFAAKAVLLKALQEQMNEKAETLSSAEELKLEMEDQIAEAERVREECRGIPSKEVIDLEARVKAVENASGWRLVSAEEDTEEPNDFGVALTLTYRDSLRLFFYPSAFQAKSGRRRSGRRSRSNSGPSAPISLSLSTEEDADEVQTRPLSTERRFMLQVIKSQLQLFSMMPRGSVSASTLLETVSSGGEMVDKISSEIRLLNMAGITTTSILGDEKLGLELNLMVNGTSRVDLHFGIHVSIQADGVTGASTSVDVKPRYGKAYEIMTGPKIRKVQQALSKEIETQVLGSGAFINAVHAFERWLQAQEQPKPVAVPVPVPVPSTPTKTDDAPTAPPVPPQEKRSPLAVKKPGTVQKRSIPVPQQRPDKVQAQLLQRSDSEKENRPPQTSTTTPISGKPAIAPELQEQMMHTPIKRVGALRRSPILGGG